VARLAQLVTTMRNILKHITFLLFLLISAGVFVCCDKEPNYPIDIPFARYYSIAPTAHWQDSKWENQIIFINSLAEMEKFVINASGYNIDFSKYTLVLVRKFHQPKGYRYDGGGTEETSMSLQEHRTKYVLNLNVFSQNGWQDRADEFPGDSWRYESSEDIRRWQHELVAGLVTSKLTTKKSEIDLTYSFDWSSFSLNNTGTSCEKFSMTFCRYLVCWPKMLENFTQKNLDDLRKHRYNTITYRSTGKIWECRIEHGDQQLYFGGNPIIEFVKFENR
jgi:hypothetical protein